MNTDILVISAFNTIFIETLVECNSIAFGGAVTDGVNGRCSTALLIVKRHSGISVFMALQDEVHIVFLDKRVENRFLYQIVIFAFDGI